MWNQIAKVEADVIVNEQGLQLKWLVLVQIATNMGIELFIDPVLLINSSTELELFLHESDNSDKPNVDEGWGKVCLVVKLNPKTQEEKEHVSQALTYVFTY